MERPESLRNPVLSVSRQISACSACRNKKIKCDGLLPACTACQRGDRAAECTNGNDQFVKGKERSYVSTLESRLDKLQRDIDQMKTQELSVNGSGLRQSVYDHQAREASNVDDLVSDFGFL